MQIIYVHATLALLAVLLGLYIFLTKKGTKQHKMLGRIWVTFLFISDTKSNNWIAWSHLHQLPKKKPPKNKLLNKLKSPLRKNPNKNNKKKVWEDSSIEPTDYSLFKHL